MSRIKSLRHRVAISVLGLIAAVGCSPNPDPCHRIVAMGDLHGGYEMFVRMMTHAGLVDAELNWIADDTCWVQTGDVVDRGEGSRRLLRLVIALQRQAPDRVFPLLGNHEVMNLSGDLRYVFPDEFGVYSEDESTQDRQRGFEQFAADSGGQGDPDSADLRAKFDEQFLPGWFAHRRAFAPDGEFGEWLITRPIIAKVGRSVFLHGGLSPEDAALGVDALNARATHELTTYLELRDQLTEMGVLSPLDPYRGLFDEVEANLESLDSEQRSVAQKFVKLRTASIFRGNGPLWIRDLARLDEDEHLDSVIAVLQAVDADRIVIGHSVQADGQITSRFGGRVLLIDTGAGPHYGGHGSALEIVGDAVRALYPGQEAKPPAVGKALDP